MPGVPATTVTCPVTGVHPVAMPRPITRVRVMIGAAGVVTAVTAVTVTATTVTVTAVVTRPVTGVRAVAIGRLIRHMSVRLRPASG